MKEKGLDEYNAELIVSDKKFAAYFDEAAKATEDAKSVANWMLGDVSAYLNANNVTIGDFPVSPTHLGEMVNLINKGVLSSKLAKKVFAEMLKTDKSPAALVKELGLEQVSDAGAIQAMVDEVLAANPQSVADIKAGKDKAIGFLVGQIMKKSRGKAGHGQSDDQEKHSRLNEIINNGIPRSWDAVIYMGRKGATAEVRETCLRRITFRPFRRAVWRRHFSLFMASLRSAASGIRLSLRVCNFRHFHGSRNELAGTFTQIWGYPLAVPLYSACAPSCFNSQLKTDNLQQTLSPIVRRIFCDTA